MKLALPIAIAAVLSFGTAAHAAPDLDTSFEARYEALPGADEAQGFAYPHPQHHHCVGLAQGTAHASCGSLTGGPSGGLF